MPDVSRITLGNRARITFALDIDGNAADPATLRFRARARSGGGIGPFSWTSAAPGTDIVKTATGRFRVDAIPTKADTWDWRYEAIDGSSKPLAATEGTLIVESRIE